MSPIPTHAELEAHALAVREREAVIRQHLEQHKATWGDGPPYFSEATFEFWSELAQGRFRIGRCGACDHVYFPPRVVCPACWEQDRAGLQPTDGVGTLVTFTDLHVVSDALRPIAPVRMSVIDLDEGVRLLTWLRGPGADDARIGQRVRIVVEEVLGRKWFVANPMAG